MAVYAFALVAASHNLRFDCLGLLRGFGLRFFDLVVRGRCRYGHRFGALGSPPDSRGYEGLAIGHYQNDHLGDVLRPLALHDNIVDIGFLDGDLVSFVRLSQVLGRRSHQ